MNRQQRRKYERKLNLSSKELDNLSEHFRRENEAKNREVVVQFLALTIEDLLDEISLKPWDIAKMSDEARAKKIQELGFNIL